MDVLLTKCEVNMAGYWLSSFLRNLVEVKKVQTKNKANYQPS